MKPTNRDIGTVLLIGAAIIGTYLLWKERKNKQTSVATYYIGNSSLGSSPVPIISTITQSGQQPIQQYVTWGSQPIIGKPGPGKTLATGTNGQRYWVSPGQAIAV